MYIGISDADLAAADMNHQNMRIGGADIVLQYQFAADPGSCGGEAGMFEFQRAGGRHAGHEGGDQRAVAVADVIHAGAVDGLARHFDLEPVQRLVHVHHQQVRRITTAAIARGHRLDTAAAQDVRIGSL